MPDGAEAISYLKGEGKYADREKFPIPYIVLADLKMPRINGFELLDWIRHQSSFPYIPVIVLTSSDETKDIHKAYQKGANSFLMKPFLPEDLQAIVEMVDSYWIKLNRVEDSKPPLKLETLIEQKPFGIQN